MKHKVTVTRKYEIEIETEELASFVVYMDTMSQMYLGHRLDTLDEGDAVGAVLELTHMLSLSNTWTIGWDHQPGMLPVKITSTFEDDLFVWDSGE